MTQKSLGMTFLNCCTMTLSHCFDRRKFNIDKLAYLCYYNNNSFIRKEFPNLGIGVKFKFWAM